VGSQIVANKADNGVTANLILGFTTGVESDVRFDPPWGDRVLGIQSFDLTYHPFVQYENVPDYSQGSAIFLYADITSFGSLAKYFMGVANTPYFYRMGVGAGNFLFAQVTEDSGGPGGTLRTATGTTVISAGSKHLVGFVHNAALNTLSVYVDPADGLPDGSTACATALWQSGTDLIVGASTYPPGGNHPDIWAVGDVAYYIGSAVPNAIAIAELYAAFKLVYEDLP
jgi:hypothetical protein